MKYKVILNDLGYIESIAHTGTDEDTVELQTENMDLDHIGCYHFVDDVCILDEGKRTLLIQDEQDGDEIAELQKKLDDTDYLVARTFEQVMALDNPLTFIKDLITITTEFRTKYAETITNREAWRERIEELENKD